jgi:antimicrobial peptide system SdpB family protein
MLKIEQFSSTYAWRSSYGLARSFLALGTLLTLLFNPIDILLKPVGGQAIVYCDRMGIGIFCLLANHLLVAQFICLLILMLVVIGWQPRWTGILHWWVAYSFTASLTVVDGGDHIATILTFLLIPITLTDDRKWHWQEGFSPSSSFSYGARSIICQLALFAIQIQVSIIYLHAATAKAHVDDWQNGTVLYYWFTHPIFGSPRYLDFIIQPIISNDFILTFLTWSIIFFEFSLFAGLYMNERLKVRFLQVGIAFHFGILLLHGLFSFFLTMCGALILFLKPMGDIKLNWIVTTGLAMIKARYVRKIF